MDLSYQSNQSAGLFFLWMHQSNQSIIKHKKSEESVQYINQNGDTNISAEQKRS
jgi:hypothetical protein